MHTNWSNSPWLRSVVKNSLSWPWPSDGGAVQLNVTPLSVDRWLTAVTGGDLGYLLTHPTPVVDAGGGMCADGICTSVQTQRRVAFQGGDAHKHRDISNYEGKQWDPQSCAGPSDKAKDCGGRPLKSWNDKEGTVFVEPGKGAVGVPDDFWAAVEKMEGRSIPIAERVG